MHLLFQRVSPVNELIEFGREIVLCISVALGLLFLTERVKRKPAKQNSAFDLKLRPLRGSHSSKLVPPATIGSHEAYQKQYQTIRLRHRKEDYIVERGVGPSGYRVA